MICTKSKASKAAHLALSFCLAVVFYSLTPPKLSFGQTTSEPSLRAEIGIRLPDARWLDPRVFPFEEQPKRGLSLEGANAPLLRWQPVSMQRKTTVDSTGQNIAVREELFEEPLRLPYAASLSDYFTQRLLYEQRMLWYRTASQSVYAAGAEKTGRGGVDIDIPVPIKSKAFSQIFGGSSVGLNVQGDIRIEGSYRRETRSEVRTLLNRGANNTFKLNQTQRFTVTGRIGEKVTVNVDQDSERAFDFENNIKLNYTGFEDEVIKKIEAGNISLSLPGTRFVTVSSTSAGLFGIKSEMQLGDLNITSVASQEKGENKKLTLSGGAADQAPYRVEDYQYRKLTYFFLDTLYRRQYRTYASKWIHTYQPGKQISRLEVYKIADESDPSSIPGVACRQPGVDGFGRPIVVDSTEIYRGFFKKLTPLVDYYPEPTLGYIRMETPVNEGDVLAVAFQDTSGRIVGDINYVANSDPTQRKEIVLKMIKDRTHLPSRDPNDTWHLEWKNVYSLGSRNIPEEGFEVKIFLKSTAAGADQEELIQEGQPARSFLNVFGLDETDRSGKGPPDAFLDNFPAIVDRARGELIFPDPRPFDPDGGPFGATTQVGETNPNRLPTILQVPTMYDTASVSLINAASKFYISVKSTNRTSTFQLGFNIIEGSEEVLLRGRRLERDKDYIIDYFSGSLTITNEEASKPDAQVEVSYQSNQLFQLEKKTILGTRAEYRLGRDSFLGGTIMYLNERSLDQRVRLGSVDKGPMKNFIWDFNTKLQFRPHFLTQALNALPLISTQETSTLNLEGEIAQIIPNPNTLNSETTGDGDGVAYVDDFEGTKRVTPLGVHRRGWVQSSIPLDIFNDKLTITFNDGIPFLDQRRALARRGRLSWYNSLVDIRRIYTGREVNSQVANTATVMNLAFTPADSAGLFEANRSWGGIMRALSAGYFDQTEAKFLEIWVNGKVGRVHIDMGQISEDIIPNNKLNSEDLVPRNKLLDNNEDVGLDGVAGNDPNDFWDVNGNGRRDWGEPASMDDFNYPSVDSRDFTQAVIQGTVNGTENSEREEGGPRPDTEDINGNSGLEIANSYFSYIVDLDPSSASNRKYRAGGSDSTGWILYRIPLVDTVASKNKPSLSNIEYVRLWVDGFDRTDTPYFMQIAEINLISNEWQEIGISTQDSTLTTFQKNDAKFDVTVVNTEENPTYSSPPGVVRDRDRITQVRVKEQSQVLRVNDLRAGEVAVTQKTFYQPLNFVNYNLLRMFIYGQDNLGQHFTATSDTSAVEFFIRFGADERNFYEFRTRVFQGWHPRNEMDVALADLSDLKRLVVEAGGDSTELERIKRENGVEQVVDGFPVSGYFRWRVPSENGGQQELRVRGNPSFTNVRLLVAGVRNLGVDNNPSDTFTGEVWMDELRVSEIQKDKGIAMRARADLRLADLANVNVEIEKLDADFHNVSTRFGTGDNTKRMSVGGSFTLDKILPQSLGLSIPVSASYSSSEATPKRFPGSDILVENTLARLTSGKRDTVLDHIQSASTQSGFNVSLSRRAKSQNFLVKNTLDNLRTSFSYTRSNSSNSTTKRANRTSYNGSVDYNLNFGRDNFVKPFAWIGKAPLFGKLSETKLYYSPQKVDARMQAASNNQVNQTRTVSAFGDRERVAPRRRSDDYNVTYNFGFSHKVFENLSLDLARNYAERVRPDTARFGADSLAGMGFTEGLGRFFSRQSDLLNSGQSFNARYNPNFVSWMNNNFSYSSTFRFSNNIQQADVGRSAGVSKNISATASIRLASFFQSLQRKKASAPPSGSQRPAPGRPTPGQRTEPEAGKKETEEDQPQRRPPPGTKPDVKPEEKPEGETTDKDKGKKEEPGKTKEQPKREGSGGIGFNPIMALVNTLAKIKDVQLNYSERNNLSHNALLDEPISYAYQFGFADDPGPGTAANYTGALRNISKGKTYDISTGFDITRNINLGLKFSYDEQETENTTKTGNSSLSWFQLGDASGGGLPFPEWTLTLNGLEKFALFKRFASSVSASTNFTGKKSIVWKDSSAGVTGEDFSISFRPLLKLNVNWKNGMVSSFQYNKTSGYKPLYNPNGLPPGVILSDDEYRDLAFQSASFTKSTDISITHTYSKRSGFRVPLPFLKNKELKNSIDLSVNFTYNNTEQSSQYGQDGEIVPNNSTKRWEFSPRMNYSFSTRVRGGSHFTIGNTQSKLSGNTKIVEFGIDVNISIRGQ